MPTTPLSPFKGLIPYDEQDAAFFFGREKDIRTIIAHLYASSLVLLYGANAVGKSSLLRAGVARKLRERSDLVVTIFNDWSSDPLAGLKRRISDTIAQAGESIHVDPSATLAEYLSECTEKLNQRFIIILDQFEEYFLYHGAAGDSSFANEFSMAVTRPNEPVSFLISMREDTLAKLDRFQGLIPQLFDNYLRLDHLSRAAARIAIQSSVEQYNQIISGNEPRVSIEPGLVEAVIDEVAAGRRVLVRDPGAGQFLNSNPTNDSVETPFLQLVMTRIWNEERKAGSNILKLATLKRLGGANDVTRAHLDSAMAELTREEQDVVAEVFNFLVTPSGSKIAQTASDLATYVDQPISRLAPIVEKLSMNRILRTVSPPADRPNESRYEVFHDVLAPAILDWKMRYFREKQRRELKLRSQRRRISEAAVVVVVLAMLLLGLYAFRQRAQAVRQREVTAQQAELLREKAAEIERLKSKAATVNEQPESKPTK